MLVRSYKENKSHTAHKRFSISNSKGSKVLTVTSTPSPVNNALSRRPTRANVALRKAKRMSVGGIMKSENAAIMSAVRRARTCSPPVSQIGSLNSTPTTMRRVKPVSSTAHAPAPISRDVEMMDLDMGSSTAPPLGFGFFNSTNLVRFRLPTRLSRPSEKSVRSEVLATINEELVDVPLEYLKDVLSENGTEMLRRLSSARIIPPNASQKTHSLPQELEVIVQDHTSADVPTHVLAIIPRKSLITPVPGSVPAQTRRVSLHLTHSLVLGLHCSSLPTSLIPILGKKPEQTVEESTNLTLPVLPLALPDPGSFGLLHGYLYSKSWKGLIGGLLPLPPASLGLFSPRSSISSTHATPPPPPPSVSSETTIKVPIDPIQLSQTLARTYTPTALSSIASRIHGLWANACSLGVYEDELWDSIDFCWGVVIEALKMGALSCSLVSKEE